MDNRKVEGRGRKVSSWGEGHWRGHKERGLRIIQDTHE